MDKTWIVTTVFCELCGQEQPLCRECDDFRRLCRAIIAICSDCRNSGVSRIEYCTCKVHFLVEEAYFRHLAEGRYAKP